MPVEPSAHWWPLAYVAGGIVGIGAVWFTQWVVSRLEKDRTNLHRHDALLQVHDLEIDTLKRDVQDLTGRRPSSRPAYQRPETD